MKERKFLARSFELSTAAGAVLAAFGAQLFLQLFLMVFKMPDKAFSWTVIILNQVVFASVALIFCFWKKVDPIAVTGLKNPPKWYYFPLFALIAVCCVTCFGPLSGLFSRVLTLLGYDRAPQYFIPMDNAGLFTLAFLALTLLPAVGEETIFRGVLLSGAKKKSPLFAIFYTALIFALIHGNLNQLVHQFLLGAVIAYLAYLTGGIYASATVHLVNNACAMLLDYGRVHDVVSKSFYWYVGGKLGAAPTVIGISVSLFALVMLLVLITCSYHRERSKVKEYDVSGGKLCDRINAYLIFLSTPDKQTEAAAKEEQGSKKRLDGYTLLMVVVLASMLAAVVLLTIIPGGK